MCIESKKLTSPRGSDFICGEIRGEKMPKSDVATGPLPILGRSSRDRACESMLQNVDEGVLTREVDGQTTFDAYYCLTVEHSIGLGVGRQGG